MRTRENVYDDDDNVAQEFGTSWDSFCIYMCVIHLSFLDPREKEKRDDQTQRATRFEETRKAPIPCTLYPILFRDVPLLSLSPV